MLRVSEPFGVAILMRGDRSVRYALLNHAGLCYVELDHPVRLHYVEALCAGNLQLSEMKPCAFTRHDARALVFNPEGEQWELGEFRAGGQGARSDLIPFYQVAIDEPDTPPARKR